MNILLASISLLTWNTHQLGKCEPVHRNQVVHYLAEQDADVVCLEEVEVRKDGLGVSLQELRNATRKKYPYTYYDFKIYNSRRQYGNVVLSRYPLINKQTPRYESLGNISSRCDIVVGNDTIRLIVNYLETNRLKPSDWVDSMATESMKRIGNKFWDAERIRSRQADVIIEAIEQSPYPVLCVGDFNTIPYSPTYIKMIQHLEDIYRACHLMSWGGTYCLKRGLWARIDYIFADKRLRGRTCEVINTPGSDHLPMTATIEW